MIISILKSNKTFFVFLLLLFGIFYWLSFTYPIVYDDAAFAQSTVDKINWKFLKFDIFKETIINMYNYHGRVGHGFVYIFIHLPLVFALLSSTMILCIYGFFPYIISTLTDKKFSIVKWIYIFAAICILSLSFPWFFYIFNDFFNRTMSVSYIFSFSGFIIYALFYWYQIMMLKPIKGSIIIYIALYFLGFFISIHNELITLYGIGMLFGVFFVATMRYKKLPVFPKTMIPVSLGVLTGFILCFTSPGMLSRMSEVTSSSSNNLYIIFKEILCISAVLFSFIIVIYAILWHKKQLILSEEKDEQEEFIYRSLYLFLVWCGFIFILYVAKIPYFRTMIIGATILPLVYLFLLGLSKLLDRITMPRYFIILPVSIIMYSTYVVIHNTNLMKNIVKDFQKQIVIAQETKTDLIVPVYEAPFKHIYVKLGNRYFYTSEMEHGNNGTYEEKQKEGMRIFFQTLSLNAPYALERWHLGFYQHKGQVSSNQTITNKY